MTTPKYYQVDVEGKPSRIVEAPSASAAIRYASKGVYKAAVLNARDLAKLIMAGVVIESGGTDAT